MPNTLHFSSLTLWVLGGLHILPRNWPTDTHTPFSLPLTNNKITTCYVWLGLGAIAARFQVFHRNYNKIKIPETVWISTSRQDNKSRTNTMESKTWSTEFGNTLCLLLSWVPGKHKKTSHGGWGATITSRGNLAKREPTAVWQQICKSRTEMRDHVLWDRLLGRP